jgi:putative ABC transport system permease protein
MNALVLAMLWQRRGQAVAIMLLSLLAVAAAVAAPAYLSATDRAVAAGQVATATPIERGIMATLTERSGPTSSDGGFGFETVGPALLAFPGFTQVYAAEYPTVGLDPDTRYSTRLVSRQDVCAHLRITAGRCAAAVGEIVVGRQTAARLKVSAGQRIVLAYAEFSQNPATPVWEPSGDPTAVTVTGIYDVPDPRDSFWSIHGYFAADPSGRPGEPAFTPSATMDQMAHGSIRKSVDSTAQPGALDEANLDGVRAGLAQLEQTRVKLGSSLYVETGLPELFERIDTGRATARLIVPVLAVPLVLLACFVIFLAAGYGADTRRPELAVVALRGVRWWERWWLATGENVLAIVAGSVLGCLAGQLLVTTTALLLFPGTPAPPGVGSLAYAPLAALAAVLAALVAQRRELFDRVAALLRRVGRPGRTRPLLELAAVVLAVVLGVQYQISGGDTSGAGMAAPALIIFAAALLLGLTLVPLVTRPAARALARGRLGLALAGFQLTRRPGAARLLALLVAAVAVVVYAAASVGSAHRDREVMAVLGTGADRVLGVAATVTPGELLTAVRKADPEGRYAMAVVRTPSRSDGELPGLAVDSTRLATVAAWGDSSQDAASVAWALHPSAPDPVVIRGRDVGLDFTASGVNPQAMLKLALALTPLDGTNPTTASLSDVHNGTSSFAVRVPACAAGCRLDGLQILSGTGSTDVTGRLLVTRLGSVNPVNDAITAEVLRDPAHWRVERYGRLSADPAGLAFDLDAPNGLGSTGAWIQPVDSPYPLPVAFAGESATTLTGLDNQSTPATPAALLHALPRLGKYAALTDLEYADRVSTGSAIAQEPEVWLNPHAPADVIDRLESQGLIVTTDIRTATVRAQLAEQGYSLALLFYVLAALIALLLAAGALALAAAVDRNRRAADLTALRTQGLPPTAARAATLWAYPLIALLAVPAGTATGVAVYSLTGPALPFAGINPPPLPLPVWPHWWIIPATALTTLLVLGTVALLSGRTSRQDLP